MLIAALIEPGTLRCPCFLFGCAAASAARASFCFSRAALRSSTSTAHSSFLVYRAAFRSSTSRRFRLLVSAICFTSCIISG
ncbi:hypothetical protein PF005_g13194 [Phytophthora fragariae]|uniref:Uncharacterized protein n=1 Tax=Phytophthora fragariae TaxID=53985 RepID=A0A6A3XQX7_9STRA|nr:hypothetical protein PF003_g35692 [Phytophthora fragariae]KAE8944119.1 hypothetical protein PF009_g6171 [Phytophthora fragariae]KAE9017654.1 hypothetical protein PF011_g6599 [Phytophthora fragariae]KAE9098739.1 hypothetical protein PF010_g15445 [Phytophthora fragariae]KAE9101278.1 hypothetical protein PF007_g15195 [Phytophthora fragariae]